MAPTSIKRKVTVPMQSARKKQKLTRESRKAKANGSNQRRGEIDVDELPWQQVTLPDRLDDVEGFFGLEEIDDVQVIKNGLGGRPQYKTIGKSVEKENCLIASESLISHVETAALAQGSSAEPESAWEGFEDEDQAQSADDDNLTAVKTKSNVLSGKGTVDEGSILGEVVVKKTSQSRPQKGPPSTRGNPFDALGTASGSEESDVSAWRDVGLSPAVLSCLANLKFSKPTPIQATSIPRILSGHDVIGKASTGSGKTLTYGIPILEYFLVSQSEEIISPTGENQHAAPLALILSPTRELAHQLSAHLNNLCKGLSGTSPRIVTVTGGLSAHKQQRQLLTADIIIGTPGRLWETISGGQGLLEKVKQVKFLVVDEADRLLSEGHFKEVGEILDSLDRQQDKERPSDLAPDSQPLTKFSSQRQTLVFSATFQKELQQKLAGKGKFRKSAPLLSDEQSMDYLLQKLNFREDVPTFIDVNPVSQMAANLTEGIVECPSLEKDLYLYALLLQPPPLRTLIFTNSISSVRRLHPFLTLLNIQSLPLHSQMPQKSRLRSVERFSSSTHPARVLIATDVAARGLDIPNVQLVVHYHVPRAADAYVHRSGRTARAGLDGKSILLCAPDEVKGVRGLVAKVHAKNSASEGKRGKFYMRTVDLDKTMVERLKSRTALAKKISEAGLASEKRRGEDEWIKSAKEELGVDSGDSEDGGLMGFGGRGGGRGRGKGRREREEKARALSKSELGALSTELKVLLAKRINVGVSERYLTSGGLDVEAFLEGNGGDFLGKVDGIEDMTR